MDVYIALIAHWSSSVNFSSVKMSNRALFSSTALSVNSNANRKWDPSNVEQGSYCAFSIPCENHMNSNTGNYVQERDKGMFSNVISAL